MTLENYNKEIKTGNEFAISNDEMKRIKQNHLYNSRLSYVKEFILNDTTTITADHLAERLDIPLKMAILILNDCLNK